MPHIEPYITWENAALIPPAWQQEAPAVPLFVFNPALARIDDGYLMVYRVVAPRYTMQRLALCRLDAGFNLVPGSVVPLSDQLGSQGNHIGDPRLFHFDGTLWLCYCDLKPPTTLYLAPLTGPPWQIAAPARPLILTGPRQWYEKNWMPFVHADHLFAVYTLAPHVILELDLSREDAILCHRAHTTEWGAAAYTRHYGELRGGAPPVLVGDRYYAFFHSSAFAPGLYPFYLQLRQQLRAWVNPPAATDWFIDPRPDQPLATAAQPPPRYHPTRTGRFLRPLSRQLDRHWARLRYYGGCYTFAATPPFAPISWIPTPILWPLDAPPPQRHHERLRAINDRVIFPTGALYDAAATGGEWVISYGLHDERCMAQRLSHAAITAGLQPICTARHTRF